MSSSALDHDISKQVFQSATVYKTNQIKAQTRAMSEVKTNHENEALIQAILVTGMACYHTHLAEALHGAKEITEYNWFQVIKQNRFILIHPSSRRSSLGLVVSWSQTNAFYSLYNFTIILIRSFL